MSRHIHFVSLTLQMLLFLSVLTKLLIPVGSKLGSALSERIQSATVAEKFRWFSSSMRLHQ